MAVAPRRTRRRPVGSLLVLAILISCVAWVLYLRLTDQELRGPFGLFGPITEAAAESETPVNEISSPREGMVRVMISAREIPAYARVTRDDLFDARRSRFAFIDLDPEFVETNGILVGTEPIVGRVMARPKAPGFPFTEKNFLPEGTRPGLAGGIPPGKRAIRVETELVQGIIGLKPGDRFDLLAARSFKPVDTQRLIGDRSGSFSSQRARATARVDVVVQGGVVISGVETRMIPTYTTSLTAGGITRTRPVQEMVIALDPEEVAPLMAALELESGLTCVARSGHPDDPEASLTPGLSETSVGGGDALTPSGYEGTGYSIIETMAGDERTFTAVPRAQQGEDR